MRTTSGLVAIVMTLALGAGCAHKEADRREARREERREDRRDSVASRGDWVKLGERSVDGSHDRDVIRVGGREGAYRKVMIVVENSALEMHDVLVTFGDGSQFSPPTRHVFGADTRSHVIDLPGAQRVIRTVEFRYGNLPGGGNAVAELWAQ